MEYFFVDLGQQASVIVLTGEEHIHCTKALRRKKGDEIRVLNGQGSVFVCNIKETNRQKTILDILREEKHDREGKDKVIVISPTKNQSRIEWFIEKATEIGMTHIFITRCDRSDKKEIKLERIQKIAISALKQSGRFYLPQIHYLPSLQTLSEILPLSSYQTFIAHCVQEEKLLTAIMHPNDNYLILIGPEGDFTTEEIKWALQHDFTPVSLGKNRLRTETAGIYAAVCFMMS
ncbi:MAG: RsmE family RNA methyltransferase [Saprospiraceae bacterium]